MNPKIEIENLLRIEGGGDEVLQAAADSLAQAATNIRLDGHDCLRFSCEWDPPFKALRTVSQAYPGTALTLWSDAFAQHHWICKADIADGQCQETVVSRVDDAFEAIFAEVYGCSYRDWEQNPSPPFAGTGGKD